MKTKEELNAMKEEVETLNKKLAELTDEELEDVTGGGLVHVRQHEEVNPETDYCSCFKARNEGSKMLCKNCRYLDAVNSECGMGARA